MSLIQNFEIDCSALVCGGALGAAGAMVQGCPANIELSEIDSIILWDSTISAPTANWAADAMVIADFDIDNTDATKLNRFFGVGNIGESEDTEITVNNFQTVKTKSRFTLNFAITGYDNATYDYFRKIQCGTVKPYLLYTDVAGKMFGKIDGILPVAFKVTFPKDEGEEGVKRILLTISWDSKTDPDMKTSPL